MLNTRRGTQWTEEHNTPILEMSDGEHFENNEEKCGQCSSSEAIRTGHCAYVSMLRIEKKKSRNAKKNSKTLSHFHQSTQHAFSTRSYERMARPEHRDALEFVDITFHVVLLLLSLFHQHPFDS